MRALASIVVVAVASTSWWVARSRTLPREVFIAAEAHGGTLALHGRVEPVRFPALRNDVRLFSIAPDGELAVRSICATDGSGHDVSASQAAAETKATTIVLSPRVERFEIDVDLKSVESGNTAVGYASDDGSALAVPTRRFLFAAESDRIRVHVDPSVGNVIAPELIGRGLYVAGDGWQRISGDLIDVLLGPEVPLEMGENVGRLTHRALARLADLGVPTPQHHPVILVVNETRDDAFARFDLPAASEVYVAQCRSGRLLESGVFRDLANAAATRLQSLRPRSESLLWTSFEGALAIRLGLEAGLAAASEQVRCAKRSYESNDRFRYVPALTPNANPAYYWFIHESVNVQLWELFWADVTASVAKSWDAWLRVVTANPATDLGRITSTCFGQTLDDRFHELMEAGGWHVPDSRSAAPNVFPGNGVADAEADQDRKSDDDVTFILTGVNLGFLDNCGCAKNQGGGVARRKFVIDEVRAKHPNSIALDLGDTLSPPLSPKSRDVESNKTLLSVLRATSYDGLVPGIAELGHDATWFRKAAAASGLNYFVANVIDRASRKPAFPPVLVVKRGSRTIHVLGLVEAPYERYYVSAIEARVLPQYEIEDPVECARSILSTAAKEDIWCVAGTLTPETTERLLASDVADRIDAVLTCSWRVGRLLSEDAAQDKRTFLREPAQRIYGHTAYLYSGFERFAVTIGTLGFDQAGVVDHLLAEIKDMPSTVARDPVVEQILAQYSREQAGDPSHWPTTPVALLPEEQRTESGYVGAVTCSKCHEKESDSWAHSRHSRAVNTLAGKTKENDVTCLRCHTTGFHWKNGFDPRREDRRGFEHVQCEVCHGPGRVHVARHVENIMSQADTIRRTPTRSVCISCHDDENSPKFDVDAAMERVRH